MIKNYHITPQNLSFLVQKMERLDPHKRWVCNVTEKKSRRSNEQNKWMRGFAADFGAHFGYSPDESYELLMYKFCPEFITDPETQEEIRKPGHFSKKQDGTPRDTKEAAEIQEAVLMWAASLGFVWDMEAA
jgi:hypothetical protein